MKKEILTAELVNEFGIEGNGNIIYKYNSKDLKEWKSMIAMSKKYARHFIKIINMRQEHLQDITEEDCIKEGIAILLSLGDYIIFVNILNNNFHVKPKDAFAELIDMIDGKGTWKRNPVVTRYEFELLKI